MSILNTWMVLNTCWSRIYSGYIKYIGWTMHTYPLQHCLLPISFLLKLFGHIGHIAGTLLSLSYIKIYHFFLQFSAMVILFQRCIIYISGMTPPWDTTFSAKLFPFTWGAHKILMVYCTLYMNVLIECSSHFHVLYMYRCISKN